MGWWYHIVTLEPEAEVDRRNLINRYGLYSQLSVLIPIAAYQIYRLALWLRARKQRADVAYSVVGEPPATPQSSHASLTALQARWRAAQWWLDGELAPDWGLRKRWIVGGVWTLWMTILCFSQTGHDYLHLAKRIGRVAAAQLPFHYLLSIRTRYSPLTALFGTSHENLIHWHQVCGRIIMMFFIAHGLLTRLRSRHAITGLMAIGLMSILMSTSIQLVRRWSYRVFFLFHLVIGLVVLPILFFHAKPLAIYTSEALAIFIVDRVLRRLATIIEPATITRIPHTDLLKVQISIPESRLARYQGSYAQHVFVGFPSDRRFGEVNRLLSNPFTIADVSNGELTLILRAGRGPTTQTLWSHADKYISKLMVSLEGPYSIKESIVARALEHDRILLVAGGIGATFMIPIYQALVEHLEGQDSGLERLNFTWALRSAAEGEWAADIGGIFRENAPIQVYLTRQGQPFIQEQLSDSAPLAENMEMGDFEPSEAGMIGGVKAAIGRPDLRKIVDDMFGHHAHERIAVLFCGPQEMARDLRLSMSPWVDQGRTVFWHQESFGW
ncbi:hypothetical protein N7468_000562 [Penicillium chermesinum]|uniref:FAD-binding FR-type domain-containing protein n=1 Tax=Penicillium chermesinum TaxID=63820 RepID=A0A9W9U0J3_9EURO|nr:uncharacterized protein N7468_000562 [Penicillium chermesinum]KAJ5249111.1 hypothetical protein N7468_000562 [Penicillium chermesinum]